MKIVIGVLEKLMSNKFEVYLGSLLHRKDEEVKNYYACVQGICIDENGETEISTQECWFYEGRLCYDYECYGESSVDEIYKYYDLVGEGFKLFKKD